MRGDRGDSMLITRDVSLNTLKHSWEQGDQGFLLQLRVITAQVNNVNVSMATLISSLPSEIHRL